MARPRPRLLPALVVLAACSSTSTGAPPPAPSALHGVVLDETGGPVARARVVVGGHSITADENGQFDLDAVAPRYDLLVLPPAGSAFLPPPFGTPEQVTAYSGLTTRAPRLRLREGWRYDASIHTASLAATPAVTTLVQTTDDSVRPLATVADGFGGAQLVWRGAAQAAARTHTFELATAPDGSQDVSRYRVASVELAAGATLGDGLGTGGPPELPTVRATVHLSAPENLGFVEAWTRLDASFGSLSIAAAQSGDDATVVLPASPIGLDVRVYVYATDLEGGTSEVWADASRGAPPAIALAASPTPVFPHDDDDAVVGSVLSWRPSLAHALRTVTAWCGGELEVVVYSDEAAVRIPDLATAGLFWPTGACTWSVEESNLAAGLDDYAGIDGALPAPTIVVRSISSRVHVLTE